MCNDQAWPDGIKSRFNDACIITSLAIMKEKFKSTNIWVWECFIIHKYEQQKALRIKPIIEGLIILLLVCSDGF